MSQLVGCWMQMYSSSGLFDAQNVLVDVSLAGKDSGGRQRRRLGKLGSAAITTLRITFCFAFELM